MRKGLRNRTSQAPEKGPLYLQVAEHVTRMIRSGALKPGKRIPSIRRLSSQQSVAISTVLHAYQVLEARGLIEARPQSGYFVKPKHARRVADSQSPLEPEMLPLPLKAGRTDLESVLLAATLSASRKNAVPLGTAIQSPEFLPTAALHRHLTRAVRNDPLVASSYQFGLGVQRLRDRIAHRVIDSGCSFGPDDIVITNGTTEALSLALRAVTSPGDTVAVESPCYFGFLSLIDMLHLKVVEVSTDPRDGISIERLEKLVTHRKVQIKALIVNPNVHNPLGSIMPDEKKRRIAEVMQRARIPVIEDDTYGDLAFGSSRPRCLKAFDDVGNVLLCSSFSKTLAPGYRTGWIAAGRWHARVRDLKCTLSLGSVTPVQIAIASYLETGGFEQHLRRLRRIYQDQLTLLSDAVRRQFPDGTRATNPKGGHLLWVELPERVDSVALHQQLAANDISVSPGSIFSAGHHYRNYLRLNAAISWSPRVEKAVAMIGRLAREACGR